MSTNSTGSADLSSTGPLARAALVALSVIVPGLVGHNIYQHVRVSKLEANPPAASAPAKCACGPGCCGPKCCGSDCACGQNCKCPVAIGYGYGKTGSAL